jgi:MinD-like ATPase involved in chromosome partitioning or flagellar assembly
MTVDAMQVVAGGYDVGKLDDQLNKFIDESKLDLLLIDTHRGFNEETLLTIAIAGMLMILLRPDKQDYHGTAVLVEVASRMAVPQVHMLANKVVGQVDRDDTFRKSNRDIITMSSVFYPSQRKKARLGSNGVFAARCYPTHPLSKELQVIAQRIME